MALASLILGVLLGAAPAAPDPDTLEQMALGEVTACLDGERWRIDGRHLAVPAVGLGLPAGTAAAQIVGAPGRLIVYQDGGGRVVECGVLVFDALPEGAPERFAEEIARDKPTLEPARPRAWRIGIGEALPGRYWGLSHAPGISGVLLRDGGDGVATPRLLVDSHSVLIR